MPTVNAAKATSTPDLGVPMNRIEPVVPGCHHTTSWCVLSRIVGEADRHGIGLVRDEQRLERDGRRQSGRRELRRRVSRPPAMGAADRIDQLVRGIVQIERSARRPTHVRVGVRAATTAVRTRTGGRSSIRPTVADAGEADPGEVGPRRERVERREPLGELAVGSLGETRVAPATVGRS